MLLGRDGRLVGGARIDLPGDIETQCLYGDTPCAGIAYPAFADDGRMYLSLHSRDLGNGDPDSTRGGALVALDVDGGVIDGWPVELPPRTHVVGLSIDGSDRLVAEGVVCGVDYCGGDGTVSTTLIFAANGELLEQGNGD